MADLPRPPSLGLGPGSQCPRRCAHAQSRPTRGSCFLATIWGASLATPRIFPPQGYHLSQRIVCFHRQLEHKDSGRRGSPVQKHRKPPVRLQPLQKRRARRLGARSTRQPSPPRRQRQPRSHPSRAHSPRARYHTSWPTSKTTQAQSPSRAPLWRHGPPNTNATQPEKGLLASLVLPPLQPTPF